MHSLIKIAYTGVQYYLLVFLIFAESLCTQAYIFFLHIKQYPLYEYFYLKIISQELATHVSYEKIRILILQLQVDKSNIQYFDRKEVEELKTLITKESNLLNNCMQLA